MTQEASQYDATAEPVGDASALDCRIVRVEIGRIELRVTDALINESWAESFATMAEAHARLIELLTARNDFAEGDLL